MCFGQHLHTKTYSLNFAFVKNSGLKNLVPIENHGSKKSKIRTSVGPSCHHAREMIDTRCDESSEKGNLVKKEQNLIVVHDVTHMDTNSLIYIS